MIICETEFDRPDKNKTYSQHEIDYYAFIPKNKQSIVENHRLSLRKNLVNNLYELYRHYHTTGKDIHLISFRSLVDAVSYACDEYRRFFGSDDHKDIVCDHKIFVSPGCFFGKRIVETINLNER